MIEHFEKCYPREACGLLKDKKFYPFKNIASEEDDFKLDPIEYLKFIKERGTPDFVVHTHPDCTPEPSEADIVSCNALNVPFLIYSYPELNEYILEPKITCLPLIGRHYKFGSLDCFQAVKDYYLEIDIDIGSRMPFVDDWWKLDMDLMSSEILKHYGFIEVDSLQPEDLITFKMHSAVDNHCGVFLGEDKFYHHAVNRLSCRENLYPVWRKFLSKVYRHETKINS